MSIALLPSTPTKEIHRKTLGSSLFGTTLGLAKKINEDRLGYRETPSGLRVCIADGHWGDEAADMIARYWLDATHDFPRTRAQAVQATEELEEKLFAAFGTDLMDAEHDKTPEAAFIFIEVKQDQVHIMSYGDCRLLIASEGKVSFQLETTATWLGAFARLGLRNRAAVKDALVFETVLLQDNDVMILYSDGIDECVYEVPTISEAQLAAFTGHGQLSTAFDAIMDQVFAHGAEDNASLALITPNR